MIPTLYTIPLSHYCERARWALDYCKVSYTEEQHLQVFAGRIVKKIGGKTTVPLLDTGDEVLSDSSDIVRWAASKQIAPNTENNLPSLLYPTSRNTMITSAEETFINAYGNATRLITYDWFFRSLPEMLKYNAGVAPKFEARFLKFGAPLLVPMIKRKFDINRKSVATANKLVSKTLDHVAKKLSDGRPYLNGDQFSAADLSFSSMTAILVFPKTYARTAAMQSTNAMTQTLSALPKASDIPDETGKKLVKQTRSHPAGKFALNMYKLHR